MNKELIKQDGKIKPRILATKNIRIELKNNFPDTKFSIKSSVFANGDSIHIIWHGGPSNEEVNKIVRKYQSGTFDIYTDCYEYQDSDFNRTYGEAKYIQCFRRKIKEEQK